MLNTMKSLIVHSVILPLLLITQCSARVVLNNYMADRIRFLEEENNLHLGSALKLTEEEKRANEILMYWKNKEIEESFGNSTRFRLSNHFFSYKKEISKSKVYQMIRRMPKGAALHIHASMMLDADSLLELTYEDHLYACFADDGLKLHFSGTVPSQSCPVNWNLLKDLREASDDVEQFDAELRKHFSLYTEGDDLLNADINDIWEKFNKVYRTTKYLITYRPIREKYFYKALENFYNDNIMYVEIRSGLHNIYELDGTTHDSLYLAQLYERITKRFIEEHPDFIGIKLILTTGRWKTIEEVRHSIATAKELKAIMPNFFAGFDLVGQEDKGKPLKEFLPALIEAKNEIDFYFHGGETNWFGTSSDENLIDAVLLGSKRVGHAYALLKHPTLLGTINLKNVVLEVNVISNVVLSLVRDVRNHPLASYLALGYPVVLSSDDPGAWDADPLSHDFYVTFVGVASKHADLRMLKQLALNSIRYSALDDDDVRKTRFYDVFNEKWDIFVKKIIENGF
ncbi:unnamed protein product [Chilo suppressalis]|uniref:adenosine deaminase n=1 Tax=Chilo suppressalis TaxID=168631 RepID=A0ABN8L8P3_CHISP|nr:unnamed protein product [Chilo suppressalis]